LVEAHRGLTAGIVSLFAQIAGLVLGLSQNPLISPSWVEAVTPLLAQIPVVGSYLAQIPVLVWATIIGFLLIWCLGYVILGWVGGSLGFLVALGIGAVIVAFLYGGIAINIPQTGG